VYTATEAVTDEIAQPELAVNIIPDGVAPAAADVEAVAEVVSAGTDIVWNKAVNSYASILIIFNL